MAPLAKGEYGTLAFWDLLDDVLKQGMEDWIDELATSSSRVDQAVALNHRQEQRVEAGAAASYAQAVSERRDAGESLATVCGCAATDTMFCCSEACPTVPAELVSFLTRDTYVAILRQAKKITRKAAKEWAGGGVRTAAFCGFANNFTVRFGLRTRNDDGDKIELLWGTAPTCIDDAWNADEIRHRLGTEWGESKMVVRARYPSGCLGACHAPTVIDARGSARFQPSRPEDYAHGMTRDGRTNDPALPEWVHRSVMVGAAGEATVEPACQGDCVTHEGPSDGYLDAKLA